MWHKSGGIEGNDRTPQKESVMTEVVSLPTTAGGLLLLVAAGRQCVEGAVSPTMWLTCCICVENPLKET